ncbi:hypothetical protein GGQ58_002842 [Paracoccus denitrificans]|jgi:hypothetical protein|nr:hypothetical protein [Paracoccus denitrificans]
MTLFDIIVPVAALAVAGAVVLIVRATDKPDSGKHHPAE